MGDATPKKTPREANLKPPWKPGQSGNPKGRPKGARDKLTRDFIKALQKSFKEHGADTLEILRVEKPEAYIAAVGKLVPKEDKLDVNMSVTEVSTTYTVVDDNPTE